MHREKINPLESHADKTKNYREMENQEPLMQRESNLVMDNEINLENIDDFLDERNRIRNPDKEELSVNKLCYKLKNKKRNI